MDNFDIKFLNTFYYIYKTKNVSTAALHLGLSQPTVSNILNKIRSHYKDPLFIRIGNEMQPTELAKQLYPLMHETLNQFNNLINYTDTFEGNNLEEEFTLAMTDVAHLVLLPQISNHLKTYAPKVKLNIYPISSETSFKLKTSEIDLAIGFLPQLDSNYYQQKLFEQHYVVIASKDHPRLKDGTLSLEQYLQEDHIEVDTSIGHFHIENEMLKLSIKRNIRVSLPSYLGIGLIIQESDAIATIPYYLSEVLLSRGNLQVFPTPINIPTYSIKQFWHVSNHNKKSQKWLRNICYEVLVK